MKENTKDEFLDLLTNEDFRRWVLDPNHQRDLFWQTWLENHPDKRDLVNTSIAIIKTRKFQELKFSKEEQDSILSSIIFNSPLSHQGTNTSIKNLTNEFSGHRSLIWPGIYRIAVTLLFLLIFGGLAYWTLQSNPEPSVNEELTFTKKENPMGRKSLIVLPDGSKVTLNASSQLTYDSNYGLHNRMVRLEGEAFFEVVPDVERPFEVHSNNVITLALGTSFNVRSYKAENVLNVSLLTGKVKVTNYANPSPTEENILTPGEGYVIDKVSGDMEKILVNPIKTYGWKDGILVFTNNNLAEVVSALENWYDVKIEVKGNPAKSWKADGKFDNETLEQVLKGLSYTYDLDFAISGKDVQIKFN